VELAGRIKSELTEKIYQMRYLPFLMLFIFACGQTNTKEQALAHYSEVYSIYHNDYQANSAWSEHLKQAMEDMGTGQTVDSAHLASIQDEIRTGMESHKKALDTLNTVKPFMSKNNILKKAKENIQGQIKTHSDLIAFVELLKGGIAEDEREQFKKLLATIQKNTEGIELWRDDLTAFRNEFHFTKEDVTALLSKFGLQTTNDD
jgi:hypothetical protein